MRERLGAEEWNQLGVGNEAMLPSWWAPLIRWFPPGSHLQEMGCCAGSTALQLAQASMRYKFTLVDFNIEALKLAYQRFVSLQATTYIATKVHLVCADVLDSTFKEDYPSGDISYSLGLLEHFQDDEIVQILKNQSSKCRTVMSAVPNARCERYTTWKKLLEDKGEWPYGYEEPKTIDQMKEYYDAAGLDVIAYTTMGDNLVDQDTDERYLLAVLGNTK